jgi:hypothetical protein
MGAGGMVHAGGNMPELEGVPYTDEKALCIDRPWAEAGEGGTSSAGVKALTMATLPTPFSGALAPQQFGCGGRGIWGLGGNGGFAVGGGIPWTGGSVTTGTGTY